MDGNVESLMKIDLRLGGLRTQINLWCCEICKVIEKRERERETLIENHVLLLPPAFSIHTLVNIVLRTMSEKENTNVYERADGGSAEQWNNEVKEQRRR